MPKLYHFLRKKKQEDQKKPLFWGCCFFYDIIRAKFNRNKMEKDESTVDTVHVVLSKQKNF